MNNANKIAILIPTLNAGDKWDELLQSVDRQITVQRKIILDSGSKDATVQKALQHGFEVLTIEKKDFDHGYARQLLADAVPECNILLYLTQDCILKGDNSVANLVEAFDNPAVGIAYGRQLPRHGATLLEAHARLFNYPSISKVKSLSDKGIMGIKTASCSNSYAAYRRDALTSAGGFPLSNIFGEDVVVGGRMLIQGYNIAYVAEAEGYHSHDYTIAEEFKRYFDVGVFHRTNDWLLAEFGSASGEGLKYVRSEFNTVIKNNFFLLPKMVTSVLVKWMGYKIGLSYYKLPNSLKRRFSMHKSYWDKQIKKA